MMEDELVSVEVLKHASLPTSLGSESVKLMSE